LAGLCQPDIDFRFSIFYTQERKGKSRSGTMSKMLSARVTSLSVDPEDDQPM